MKKKLLPKLDEKISSSALFMCAKCGKQVGTLSDSGVYIPKVCISNRTDHELIIYKQESQRHRFRNVSIFLSGSRSVALRALSIDGNEMFSAYLLKPLYNALKAFEWWSYPPDNFLVVITMLPVRSKLWYWGKRIPSQKSFQDEVQCIRNAIAI